MRTKIILVNLIKIILTLKIILILYLSFINKSEVEKMDSKQQLINAVNNIAEEITSPELINKMDYCPEDWDELTQEEQDEYEVTASDYLHDALDLVHIIRHASNEHIGSEICVTFGGPNIYINTRTNCVEGYWGGDKVERNFTDNLGLDEYCEELYNCYK